ncbi:PLP-dependent aminotransferase family protein [Kaistia dalseonensis]|uniref:GntR family transcriptional regulator/MocR family aminotransferase n=1 Tax=Kaistia dalseonensis TaxID=410840 RepID=A0ABU0H3W6_9HYPH|nr:PLP-dependent aminotransferase family protein [Kaistia dalseonensis]MCX5494422.1 PLP-dependent aminotransferase family protein [Kaistia dalseonensis]MDQ0437001.1 GntR family transcriptional regulator/MocR family aminotransferase [Kaistia dalseonensis]
MRQSFPLESLMLSRTSAVPLHRQLYEALRGLIQDRTLAAGSALPSTRALAGDLAIARNTVTVAYDQLATEGYILPRQGARPMVVDLPTGAAGDLPSAPAVPVHRISRRGDLMIQQPVHHGTPGQLAFHPGMPDADSFPFSTWGRLVAKHARFARGTLFGTYHVTGHPELRIAIANYLKASRGVRCSPEQIVVTTGAQAALDLLARLLLDPGDTVWMEEPGYYGAHAAFTAAGAQFAPLHVNENGWDIEEPAGAAPRLIYVTPSCQHPMGATMRMDQRLRLLEIADTRDAWIIEDDFDGEYRFHGQPIPAMQGADTTERVVYVGTFAKILFPALRLGFMVLPRRLADGMARALSITGQFAPLILQAALADFIEEGHMARHLRRMRRLYATRRQAFRSLCEAELADWLRIVPGESGIQMVGMLADGLDDHAIAAEARLRGMSISPLSIQYRHGSPRQGLLLGYAGATEPMMHRGIIALGEAHRAALPLKPAT